MKKKVFTLCFNIAAMTFALVEIKLADVSAMFDRQIILETINKSI